MPGSRVPPAGPASWPQGGGAIIILGVGNILYSDEGVGVYAAHAIQRSYRCTPEVEVLDGATLGFGMIDVFCRASTLIVLDALAADAPAGSVFRLTAEQLEQLGPKVRPTAHEVDPLHLLKMAPLLATPPDLVLLGIVPANTSDMAVGLTSALADAFPRFVHAAVEELRAQGVQVEPVATLPVHEVIAGLVRGVR